MFAEISFRDSLTVCFRQYGVSRDDSAALTLRLSGTAQSVPPFCSIIGFTRSVSHSSIKRSFRYGA